VRLWRITRAVHAPLDGEGARRYGGRWTPSGFAAVYASATLSLAALERFVHTDPDLEPDDLVALAIDVPDDVEVQTVEATALPEHWRAYPAPPELARVGEQWMRERTAAVLAVLSAVIPQERNFVLNPSHPACARIRPLAPQPFSFDPRMWRTGARALRGTPPRP